MKILVFGDSHSVYFTLNNELKSINESFRGVNIKLVSMTGSTISGFGKRQSTLNSREFFSQELAAFKPDFICFALGQVDIELGFYYRKIIKKEDLSIHEYVGSLVSTYLKSVKEVQEEFDIPDECICFKGINISVLTNSRDKAVDYTSRIINENVEDADLKILYQKELRVNFPSNLERYKNHISFNESLKSSIYNKYKYFDINDVITDSSTLGACRLECIPSKKDHHILDSLFIRQLSVSRLLSACLDI